MEPYNCIHCGQAAKGYVHLEGGSRGLQRCNPGDSGLPYGYNAHRLGTVCKNPCKGEYTPDPNAIQCSDHNPVQFRGGKPPHCRKCGLTKDFQKPVSVFDRKD